LSDFATHLEKVAAAAHTRWRLEWKSAAWNSALANTKAAAAAAIQEGADFDFILFVLTSYRWRHTVASRAAMAAHTFLRDVMKAYERAVEEAGGPLGVERWAEPLLSHRVVLLHDERTVFDEDARRSAALLKGRPTRQATYGCQVKSDRLYEGVGALDWYLRSTGVRLPAGVIAKVMRTFGLLGDSSSQEALDRVHTRRHRMGKVTPQTDGALLHLLLQFHRHHQKLRMPCGSTCSQIPGGDREIAVTFAGRSARTHLKEHLVLVPDRIRSRPRKPKRGRSRRADR